MLWMLSSATSAPATSAGVPTCTVPCGKISQHAQLQRAHELTGLAYNDGVEAGGLPRGDVARTVVEEHLPWTHAQRSIESSHDGRNRSEKCERK